jgi:hypothetical protein
MTESSEDIAAMLGWSPSSLLRAIHTTEEDEEATKDDIAPNSLYNNYVIDLTDSPSPTPPSSTLLPTLGEEKVLSLHTSSGCGNVPLEHNKRPRDPHLVDVVQVLSTKLSRYSISTEDNNKKNKPVQQVMCVETKCFHFSSLQTKPTQRPVQKENTALPLATSNSIYAMQPSPVIDLRQVSTYISVIIDIETTGFSCKTDNIIQLAAKANWIGANGLWSSSTFSEYVTLPFSRSRRKAQVPYHITKLTGITSKTLRTRGISFDKVWCNFKSWMATCSKQSSRIEEGSSAPIVMMAHNGKAFDFPFLQATLERFQIHRDWEMEANIICFVDTLLVLRSDSAWDINEYDGLMNESKESISNNRKHDDENLVNNHQQQNDTTADATSSNGDTALIRSQQSSKQRKTKPLKLGLNVLHEYLFHRAIVGAHNAQADVGALCAILCAPSIRNNWRGVANSLQFKRRDTQLHQIVDGV